MSIGSDAPAAPAARGSRSTLCAPDEMGELKDIEKVIKGEIPVASGRRWAPSQEEAKPKRGGGGGGGRRGGGGGGGGRPQGAARPDGGGNRRRRPRKSA